MLLDPALHFKPDRAAAALEKRYASAPAEHVMHAALRIFAGDVAILSSFGAESAVLLHMAAEINPHTPVLLLDTHMLFAETLEYQLELSAYLGLTDVRRIQPDAAALAQSDRFNALHATDPDRCCAIRKVAPLDRALEPFHAVISGRKRFQAKTRASLGCKPCTSRVKDGEDLRSGRWRGHTKTECGIHLNPNSFAERRAE